MGLRSRLAHSRAMWLLYLTILVVATADILTGGRAFAGNWVTLVAFVWLFARRGGGGGKK
jgi:Mg/Co/Ni transporter MgtE